MIGKILNKIGSSILELDFATVFGFFVVILVIVLVIAFPVGIFNLFIK